jgi:putative acetyltransferase
MVIRAEEPRDSRAIHSVEAAAFGQPTEAELVDALRRDATPLVSLVADDAGAIVGHALFSPVTLDGNPALRLMGLGPMAVAPARQRSGIGAALVREGLAACARTGIAGVVVLGHPEYYPRFGFVPASRFGIGSEYDAPDEAFMAIELVAGTLAAATGTVRYHPAFGAVA